MITPKTQDNAQNNKKVIVEHQDLISTVKTLSYCYKCHKARDILYNGLCKECILK
jgi:hypothetical protein